MHGDRTFPPLASSAHWASASDGACGNHVLNGSRDNIGTTDDDHWDAHEPEELLTFFVVLSSDSNGSSRELVHLFSGTCFLGFFAVSFCLLSPLETFRELHVYTRHE